MIVYCAQSVNLIYTDKYKSEKLFTLLKEARPQIHGAQLYFVYSSSYKEEGIIYGLGMGTNGAVHFETFNEETWKFEKRGNKPMIVLAETETRKSSAGILLPDVFSCYN